MIVLLTRHSNNQPVSLTKQIADSGEGQVWKTNLNGYLAKIYHDPTPARIAKLKVMLANPPADPMLSHNHVSIAWLSDLLKDSNGKYIGFLMPAIADSKQLSSVYNPRRRKKVAPGFNWYYLHVTALNASWIIQEIHAKGYVLGDIKLENILVNDRAMTAVIDTDSFQVRDPQSNKVYRCTVGSEGFTPPELLGKDFDTTNQTELHDRFRLGVLIHYLLFGYHPFSGQWTGVGESPEQTELIKQGYWYAAHNSPIRPSQTTIPLYVVHPELKKLFLLCFNEGHTKPPLRPTAKDWHNALEVAVNQLTSCSRVDSHHYSKHYGKCYWCDRAANLGVDIFPGGVGNRATNQSKADSKTFAVNKTSGLVNQNSSISPNLTSKQSILQSLGNSSSLHKSKLPGQKFWLQGILATSVGSFVSLFLLLAMSGEVALTILVVSGTFLVMLPWLVLRKQIPISIRWILATSIGYFALWFFAGYLALFTTVFVNGAMLVVLQWLFWKKQLPISSWWILATYASNFSLWFLAGYSGRSTIVFVNVAILVILVLQWLFWKKQLSL